MVPAPPCGRSARRRLVPHKALSASVASHGMPYVYVMPLALRWRRSRRSVLHQAEGHAAPHYRCLQHRRPTSARPRLPARKWYFTAKINNFGRCSAKTLVRLRLEMAQIETTLAKQEAMTLKLLGSLWGGIVLLAQWYHAQEPDDASSQDV
jgi:hypothetical protein